MDIQTVSVDVVVRHPVDWPSATELGASWTGKWPRPWRRLDAVIAAINRILPDGSSPSHNDRVTVLSGSGQTNVSGELFTMGGLEADQELTFRLAVVGFGMLV